MIHRLAIALALCAPLAVSAQSPTTQELAALMPPALPGWTRDPAPEVVKIFEGQGDAVAAYTYQSVTERFLMVFSHSGMLADIWTGGGASDPDPNPNSFRSEFAGYPMQVDADGTITMLIGKTVIQATGDLDIDGALPFLQHSTLPLSKH